MEIPLLLIHTKETYMRQLALILLLCIGQIIYAQDIFIIDTLNLKFKTDLIALYKSRVTKQKEVFLLTPDEYDKIKRLSDNIKEMIELKMKAIKLYKQYIPGSLMKIIEEK